jgi:hypothetical protein
VFLTPIQYELNTFKARFVRPPTEFIHPFDVSIGVVSILEGKIQRRDPISDENSELKAASN